MATFNINNTTDLFGGFYGADWIGTVWTPTQLTGEILDYQLVLTGTGLGVDALGDPIGTITGVQLYYIDFSTGSPVLSLVTEGTGLNHSLAGFGNAADTGQWGGFDFLLNGNDVITGSGLLIGGDGNDSITGSAGDDTLYGDDIFGGLAAGNDTLIGGGGHDDLNGGGGNDSLVGEAGDDYLNGGDGADTMLGGTGDDAYYVDNTGDLVIENSGEGTRDSVQVSEQNGLLAYTLPANVENLTFWRWGQSPAVMTLTGNAQANKIGPSQFDAGGSEQLFGMGGNDRLFAGDGDDTLDGGTGDDTMIGSWGGDEYFVDSLGDQTVEDVAFDPYDMTRDTVWSPLTWTLAAGLEDLVLTGVANINGTGNALDNDLNGNAGNNVLNGGAGNDTACFDNVGWAVTASLVTGTANHVTGNDTLVSIENLYGSSFDDTLTGNNGNNVLEGNGGNDTLDGGAGSDTASYNDALSAVTVNLSLAGAQNTVGAGIDTLISIENLRGSDFNDTLSGNAGNNILGGGGGNDTLDGGAGTDTASYMQAKTGMTANLAMGLGQVGLSIDVLSNFENLIGGNYDDDLTGNAGNNVLEGLLGDDTLDGGAGTDTASYFRALSGVTVSLALATAQSTVGAGTDTLIGIENLTGSNFNDTLTGNAGNNVLDGAGGVDTLAGGAGNDTYWVNALGETSTEAAGQGNDTVVSSVSWTLAANLEQLVLASGNTNINGTGNGLDNTLTGNAGNNVLDGAGGVDTASFSNATGTVTVNLATGAATGFGTDTLANIENLIGSAYADTLTGNAGNNMLEGGVGNDALDGGGGADNASYASAAAGVTVNLTLAGAQNTVGAGIDTLTSIENLMGSGFNDTLTGDAGNNVLEGRAGNDILNGGAGYDTAAYTTIAAGVSVNLSLAGAQNTGPAGIDTLSGIENLVGSNYNDTLTGDAGNNNLDGYAGNDTLNGNAGADLIRGGGGNDTLTGGPGMDTFRFDVPANAASNLDTLTDFTPADDTIELENAVFAKLTATGPLAAGNFSATGVATDADDYVVYDAAIGALYYDADGNGAGAAVQVASLGTTVHPVITAADFVVT